MVETLIRREQRLSEEFANRTARGFERVSRLIAFPPNLSGLTIIDIGAGVSTTALELQRRGAKVLALDCRYMNLELLSASVKTLPAELIQQSKDKIELLERKLDEEADGRSVSIEEFSNSFADVIVDSIDLAEEEDRLGKLKTYSRQARRTTRKFLRAHEESKVSPVAALPGRLPLHDESVDLCFSVNGIMGFLLDRGVLRKTVTEALRVLKPGGELQVHPWIGGSFQWSETAVQSSNGLLQYLKRKKVPHFVEPIGPASEIPPRLRVVKP